jgi:hypothetical protein
MQQIIVDHEMDRFNRPLEQIINEGSLGKIEEEKPKKTQAELDYELMTTKFNPGRDLIVMSPERLAAILELGRPYPLMAGVTIEMLFKHILVFDGVRNIGIVKS